MIQTVTEKLRIASVAVALLAAFMKIMHWPGANNLLIVGLGTLALCHLIRAFDKGGLKGKVLYVQYVSNYSVAILVIGALFTLMHWPNGRILLYIGLITAGTAYLAEYFWKDSTDKLENQ